MTTASTTTDREVTMSTFSITCPNCGDVLTATDAGFSATFVTTDDGCFCGEISPRTRKSAAYAAATPTTGARHTDGLVEFE